MYVDYIIIISIYMNNMQQSDYNNCHPLLEVVECSGCGFGCVGWSNSFSQLGQLLLASKGKATGSSRQRCGSLVQ